MTFLHTSRCLRAIVLASSLLPLATGFCAAREQGQRVQRPAPQPPQRVGPKSSIGPKNGQEHLPQWIERHQSLSPEQQQRALESEPGFHQLPPQTQQRMRERLSQLSSMPPAQRTHVLERAEQMENLNPQQRQQVRGAMAQLGALPADRRRVVAKAFRDMRSMGPQQRQAFMNSEYLQRQLSPNERGTLMNLMTVEPLLPLQHPAQGTVPLSPPPQ